MQIKFNKIVKPVVPLSESELSQPVPTELTQEEVEEAAAEEIEEVAQPEAEEIEQTDAEEVEAPEGEITEPVRRGGLKIEDSLRKFIGKQIRIYMADHEYVAGKLEIVEDGWVKICNARSAGSDYYFDEDIINTRNVVRVRASVTIDKKQYVDFMNSTN